MSYSQFTTLAAALNAFSLTVSEQRFFPMLEPLAASEVFRSYLDETLPLAASGSEKVRSEGIIYPVLIEVRRILNRQIAVFSGEEFSVDETVGLNGIVDFLISRSPIISTIMAPAAVIVEAKKADIKSGYGQCVAEMVAAQRFNQAKAQPLPAIYGCVSNGTQWRFIELVDTTVTIDLTDYSLPPVEPILAFLVWMLQQQ